MDSKAAEPWPASWQTLEHGIRSGRYTDPEFAKLEHAKLWRRVWQVAARLDELATRGTAKQALWALLDRGETGPDAA